MASRRAVIGRVARTTVQTLDVTAAHVIDAHTVVTTHESVVTLARSRLLVGASLHRCGAHDNGVGPGDGVEAHVAGNDRSHQGGHSLRVGTAGCEQAVTGI